MKNQVIATVTIDICKAKRKHRQHLTGSGTHDNRPKRMRTRQSQRRHELSIQD